MRRDIDGRLAALAAKQHLVFSREQAMAAGAYARMRHRRLASGVWVPLGDAAYGFGHTPPPWRGVLQAAVWDGGPGTLVSHAGAAQLHRFPGFVEQLVEILVPKSLDHVCTIAKVHESRRFDRVSSTRVDGLPVVAAPDTLVHVAPRLRFARLEWLTDELLAAKKVSLTALRAAFTSLSPGCRGMRGLRALLRDRSPGDAVPESQLEREFLKLATKSRLPPFQRQVVMSWRDRAVGRVDFVWPDVQLIVETDGRRWHTRRADFDRDARRDLDALAHGYRTAHITWAMLREDPDFVCKSLLDVRTAAA